MKGLKIVSWIAALIALASLGVYWGFFRDQAARTLALTEAQPGVVVKSLSLRGRSQARVRAEVRAQVEGRVAALRVRLDEMVSTDQILAELSLAPDFVLKVQEAAAEYQQALAGREQQRSLVVDSPARGRIIRILVDPGETVKAGQPLALIALEPAFLERLDNLALEIARLKEEADYQEREAAGLKELLAEDLASPEALHQAEAALERLRESVTVHQRQQARLGRQLKRLERPGSNEAQLLAPRSSRVVRVVKEEGQFVAPGENGALLYLARRAENGSKPTPDGGRLDLSLMRLRQAESRLEALSAVAGRSYLDDQSELSRAYVLSPVAGTVTWVNLNLAPGYTCHPQEALFQVEDLSRLLVLCRVHEIDYPQIKPGQRVEIIFDAFPGLVAPARLYGQPKAPRTDPTDYFTEYEVIFDLKNPDGRLVGGLSCEVVVYQAEKETGLTLPVSCLSNEKGRSMVYLVEGGRPRLVAVEVGLVGNRRVEILNGLAPGQKVVLFPENVPAG